MRDITPNITLHKRKYQPGDEVSTDDLVLARKTFARAATRNAKYLPLFEIIDAEIQRRTSQQDALQRAAAFAAGTPT